MTGNEWMNTQHWQEDRTMEDRTFWKQYNRRKHAYWQDHKQEQREAFREECAKPTPEQKPLTRVLEIKR